MRKELIATAALLLASSAGFAAAEDARPKYDLGQPYIGGPLPAGETLAPPAPADGSARALRDLADNAAYLALAGGARWELAARDADLGPGWFTRAFSCAAGRVISDSDTPRLAQLLRRAGTDFGTATSGVKERYMRARPFTVNGAASCTPQDEEGLRTNGSYPSGHAAIGYGTGLVLAAVFPERASALVARGRAYGTSRAVCNVHWTSDVEEGQAIASATFARLMADAAFRADLDAAKREAEGLASVDVGNFACASEAAALAEVR
jgi:acid phosphatase (class A)